MTDIYRTQIKEAIREWLRDLRDNYPDWRDSNEKRFQHIWHCDAMSPSLVEEDTSEFTFPGEVEKQRAVVLRYLELYLAIEALKESEFYFRRYPFRGLPVTRSNHVSNICEMYFGRFYQFKEKLKKHFRAVEDVAPTPAQDAITANAVKHFAGNFIKGYTKKFEKELRARNSIHHREPFKDIEISRIDLKELLHEAFDSKIERQIRSNEYRKTVKFWVQQVRNNGMEMDSFLERIAQFTLEHCQFLSDVRKN